MTCSLWLCFILSGAAALALEMLWMRSAGLIAGQTAQITATVLACFFAGLGLGAALARNAMRSPVRVYGLLELGAAAGAVWSLVVFRTLGSDVGQEWLTTIGPIGRIIGIALAIIPAAVCLGATLPAIGQALVNVDQLGRRGGLLYAANTLGGAVGAAAMGFGLPRLIGVTASYGAATAANIVAGTVALAISRRERQSVTATATRAGPRVARRGRLRFVAAGAGALGLGLEVLWTRLFAQVLHNSTYSFTAIALVFLLALAAGSAIAAIVLRRARPVSVAAVALIAAAVATAAGVWIFVRWTDGLAYLGMRSGLGEYLLRVVALAAATAGPGALASGIVLPALWAMWGRPDSAARPLGDLSAANTLGGIVGAITAGFVALPVLGLRGTLLATAISYLALADMIALPRGRSRPLVYAALLGVVIVDPNRIPLAHLDPKTETLKAASEGPSGIVTIVESQGDIQLRLDNYYVLGGTAAEINERRLGLVPLLLHPNPRRVAFVGLATGITASAAPALGVDETTVVEVVPEVAAAARAHFAPWNGSVMERPDVHLVVDDGRRFLAGTRARFDVIVSDLFIPWHAGAGSLYTREMYETVARRLEPDGLFCQWLPLYQLTREEFDVITHTFLSVFPQASLWRADFYPDRPVVGLVASRSPVDLERVRERVDQLPVWSRDPLLASPRGLIMLAAGNLAAAADLFSGTPINTDDRPLIEFTAPQLTRVNAAGDKDWFTGDALAAFYDRLADHVARAPDPLLPMRDDVADARSAGCAMYHYSLAATRHDDAGAAKLETMVRALVPEVIQAAESTETFGSLTEARRQQARLRTEQALVRQQLEAMEHRLAELTSSRKDAP